MRLIQLLLLEEEEMLQRHRQEQVTKQKEQVSSLSPGPAASSRPLSVEPNMEPGGKGGLSMV